jgi:hypothetical protein
MLLIIIVLNLYYFFKLRISDWKWIKLVYAINSGIVWLLFTERFISTTILKPGLDSIYHSISATLLIATLLGGTIVSQAKLIQSGYNIVDDIKKLTKRG